MAQDTNGKASCTNGPGLYRKANQENQGSKKHSTVVYDQCLLPPDCWLEFLPWLPPTDIEWDVLAKQTLSFLSWFLPWYFITATVIHFLVSYLRFTCHIIPSVKGYILFFINVGRSINIHCLISEGKAQNQCWLDLLELNLWP